jgi:uncharacterized protein (DUF488 family)
MTIYTIGHSTRTLDELVALLQHYKIEQLVDVRSVPRSRHTPQFNEDTLTVELPKRGIAYTHLAKLGGLRHSKKDSINQGWHNASFRGYADYMQTEDFTAGLNELLRIAAGGHSVSCLDAVQGSKEERVSRMNDTVNERKTPADAAMRREASGRQALPGGRTTARKAVAIMCAEAVPWRCHRSMIGDALLIRGIEVLDIFDAKKAQAEKLTSFAKVDGTTITYPAVDEAA